MNMPMLLYYVILMWLLKILNISFNISSNISDNNIELSNDDRSDDLIVLECDDIFFGI